jgi:transposase-like protein
MITVNVKLFAMIRDLTGKDELKISLSTDSSLVELWEAIIKQYHALAPWKEHVRFAVNCEYVPLNCVVHDNDEVLEFLRLLYNASSYHEAQRLKQEFIRRYRSVYPKAAQSLQEVGESLFTYFQFPQRHWKSIKTTNPIESLFATVKLRIAAARRIRNRLSAVCLVFQLLKTSERRLNKIRAYQIVSDTIDHLISNKPAIKVRHAA